MKIRALRSLLHQLLGNAERVTPYPKDREAQRRSFAFGNDDEDDEDDECSFCDGTGIDPDRQDTRGEEVPCHECGGSGTA